MKKKLIIILLTTVALSGCNNSNKVKDHIHTFDINWLSSSEGHFHKCIYTGCYQTSNVQPHDYDYDGICTVCGFNIDDEDLSLTCVHTWSDWEIIELPTCVDRGYRERYCSKCGKEQTRTVDLDSVDGHSWVPDNAYNKEPTCTESGMKGSVYCEYCGLRKKGETISPLGHNYLVKSHALSKEPTCTETGVVYEECSRCQESCLIEIPALGHELVSNMPVAPNGYTDVADEFCTRCRERFISWDANDVTDACKNEKRLASENQIPYVGEYEPNYEEDSDGGVKFWGRPIHNAMEIDKSGGVAGIVDSPKYDATVAGSFLEYKIKIDSDMQNAELVADIKLAPYSTNLFTAESPSLTPGLIDSDDNFYPTRYVVSLDGNVLEQDLTNDIPFFNIKTDNTPRDWFTFPLKNSLNLTAGTHTLRISMGSGYISTFYHFKLQNEN